MSMTQVPFDTNMWFLLIAFTFILLLLWGLRVLKTGKLTIAWNGTTKRLGFLVLASLVSLLFSPNKTESILTPFGLGTFLSLFFMTLVGVTFLNEQGKNILKWALMATVSLSGLLAIYQFFGLGKILFPWTPVGTDVDLMTILLVTLPILIRETFHRKHAGHDTHMIVALVMSIACLGGLILTAYQVLPKWSSTTLPFWVNWELLLESYKNLKQLMVGVGAQNFLGAFTAGRPVSLNMTPLWNTRFTVGSSTLFHFATVYGLVGAAALVYFLWGLLTIFVRPPLANVVMVLSLVFLPPSFPALILITTLLILSESSHPVSLKGSHPSRLIAVPVLLLAAAASYGLFRAYGAELAFGKSLRAFDSREGTNAYNLQIQAITFNPHVARFHMAYAQTNLALANAISGAASPSAEDRQTATQLIQQAIREAKFAVNLAPNNILVWENIATVYQELTGVAQGADQWTVASYQKAMQLDPTNPTLRLRLGGAFVGQQKFDRASEQYITAIELKPNYANAYYNLGFVYRETKKYLDAAQAIQEALKYVTPGSEGAAQGQKELTDLRELLTETEKKVLDNPESAPVIEPQSAPSGAANQQSTTEPLSPLP